MCGGHGRGCAWIGVVVELLIGWKWRLPDGYDGRVSVVDGQMIGHWRLESSLSSSHRGSVTGSMFPECKDADESIA